MIQWLITGHLQTNNVHQYKSETDYLEVVDKEPHFSSSTPLEKTPFLVKLDK